MERIAEGLWLLHYPLRLLGTEQGRVVTVIRLKSGKLVIHSTAPFRAVDAVGIRALGEPAWFVEAMLLHDTYTKAGMAIFPGLPLLAPPGFAEVAGVPAQPLSPAPPEWGDELQVLPLEGVPKIKEHLLYHAASKTLIVGDLVFNYAEPGNLWERFFRRFGLGLKLHPDMTRVFVALVQDRERFIASMQVAMKWDFDRIIVGHKDVVERGGKEKLRAALQRHGFAVS